MKKEKVLIISRQPEIYSNQRLVQELHLKNVSYRITDPEDVDFGQSQIALLRIASWRFQAAIENLSKLEIPMINSLESFQRSRNKWLSLQALGKNKIPTPLTQLISREEFEWIEMTYPFVLKELFSTQGLGVFLIKTKDELQQTLLKQKESDLFLVQQYIQECHGEDLRIFVTQQGLSWSMKRKNYTGDFRSNLHCGGLAEKASTTQEELNMAFAALEIFELDYAGIDILRSQHGPLIIEVNPSPGFEGLESIHGPEIAGPLVDLVLSKL